MVRDGKWQREAFKQGDFDLILMDIPIALMSGLATSAASRSTEKQRRA